MSGDDGEEVSLAHAEAQRPLGTVRRQGIGRGPVHQQHIRADDLVGDPARPLGAHLPAHHDEQVPHREGSCGNGALGSQVIELYT